MMKRGSPQSSRASGQVPGEAQKYVLFGLAGGTYGLALLQLQEIIARYQVTALPSLPDFFHGVLGLRGEVIPILNLRRRLGFPDAEPKRSNRVIVVDLEPNAIGIQVDEVFRVASIRSEQIGEAPELSGGQRVRFVKGVSEIDDGRLVIHLDIQELLSSIEDIALDDLHESIRKAYRSGEAPGEDGGASSVGSADSDATAAAPSETNHQREAEEAVP